MEQNGVYHYLWSLVTQFGPLVLHWRSASASNLICIKFELKDKHNLYSAKHPEGPEMQIYFYSPKSVSQIQELHDWVLEVTLPHTKPRNCLQPIPIFTILLFGHVIYVRWQIVKGSQDMDDYQRSLLISHICLINFTYSRQPLSRCVCVCIYVCVCVCVFIWTSFSFAFAEQIELWKNHQYAFKNVWLNFVRLVFILSLRSKFSSTKISSVKIFCKMTRRRKYAHYEFYGGWYSPSNGITASGVIGHLHLNFHRQHF